MYNVAFLAEAHQRLRPRAYLEIGVRFGRSLALAHCRAVGIDPAYSITAELDGNVALFRTTSDEYFARDGSPLTPTGGVPFDLSFIDGLHLFEFALRDFIHAEKCSAARGVIIFDDVLPRNVDEAARQRHTGAWTGDVFMILEVLARYRPELLVVAVDTRPTGSLVVVGLDPTDTVLADNYADIVAEYRRPDPQAVPAEILDRTIVVAPRRFLEAKLFEALTTLPPEATSGEILERLKPLVSQRLGTAYVTVG